MIILDEKGWMCMKKPERIFVIGHKNPDTDSICSAIAYADIKNRTTQNKKYIPKRAGQINEETRYVLNRFGVQPPAYLGNIGTQVKDMDRAALKSALTSKVQDNKLVVVDSLALAEVKTKEMQKVLTNLKAEKALVITADNDQNVVLSARNIADVETATPATINTYDVMKHNTVVVTKDAVASIEEVYA